MVIRPHTDASASIEVLLLIQTFAEARRRCNRKIRHESPKGDNDWDEDWWYWGKVLNLRGKGWMRMMVRNREGWEIKNDVDMQEMNGGAWLRNGTYRIDRILGQGGFGITYLATDVMLDRQVAIKEFFPSAYCFRDDRGCLTLTSAGSVEFVDMLKAKFLKEVRNIAKLDHPGIVKIHAVFEENNTAYYVMDYIKGESLSSKIKRNGPLAIDVALRYVNYIGGALQHVHSKHINHLDIKPANVMVREGDDIPILIDFGLSKHYDTNGNQTTVTPTGISHGFAPLEQYNEGGVKEFSPQTDVYSLAATLYYLITGTVPPHAANLLEYGIQFPTNVPMRLRTAIMKGMSVKRTDRYPSVMAFISELRNDGDERTVMDNVVVPKKEENKKIAVKESPGREEDEKRDNRKDVRYLILWVLLLVFMILSFIWFNSTL